MSAFPTTLPVRLDPQGRIDVDVSCPACGYNLRMQRLSPGGACPECGKALDVVARQNADLLGHADAGWLTKVRRGTRWLHVAVWASMPLVLPGLLLATAALWLLTTREPGRRETWYARGTRLSARWASVLAALAGLALLGVLILRGWGREQSWTFAAVSAADWDVFDLLICTAGAAMAVALLEAWRHLFALAARADGPDVAQQCRRTWKRYMVGVGLIMALAVGTNLADWLDVRLPSPAFQYTALLMSAFVGGVLVWMWWATLSLTRSLVRVVDPQRADDDANPSSPGLVA